VAGLAGVGVSAVWLWQSSDTESTGAPALAAELGPRRGQLGWRMHF
jgi:hypothetical protein